MVSVCELHGTIGVRDVHVARRQSSESLSHLLRTRRHVSCTVERTAVTTEPHQTP